MCFYDFLFRLKNFLFPDVCVLCGADFTGAGEIRFALCKNCRAVIVPVQGDKCNLCGKPLISERERCLSCRGDENRSYDRLWTLFPYTGKYRKLLTAYKFNKTLPLAELFAEKIMEAIKGEPLLKDAVIVPVPPRPGKIKNSGWDQVEYLIKRLEMKGSVQISRCLKREKSKVQKRLSRTERMENLKGRILPNGAAPKIALIIDDVITTGSTMEICASVLKSHGAEKVYGLCLFYD